jgi:hypothetical protein
LLLASCARSPSFDILGSWWAVANFREGQLRRIEPGMRADVYVMSRPSVRSGGIVDSVGFGVTPEPDFVGRLQPGLPDVQRTLNWVQALALRDRIRRWQPRLRLLFLTRIALLKYRLQLPGFELPEPVRLAQEEFDSRLG